MIEDPTGLADAEPPPASTEACDAPADPAEAVRSPDARLLAALRDATGIDTLDHDEDGDVGLRFVTLPVSVRIVDRPPRVRIHAVVLADGEPDVDLLERLNALNAQGGDIRWFANGRRVVAVAEIPAEPVVPSHVAQALQGFCETVEGIARRMRVEFGEDAIKLVRGSERRVLH